MIILALLLPLALGLLFLDDGNSDDASGEVDLTEQDDATSNPAAEDIIAGTQDNDLLTGTRGDDFIRGGDGNDTLFGSAGHDLINGDNGQDEVHGDNGDDYLLGGNDADTLHGGQGLDLLSGGSQNDVLFGERGVDTLGGDDGNDTLSGGSSPDFLLGGNGADELSGDAGHDFLVGGHGADQIEGGEGDDVLYGGLTSFEGGASGQVDHTAESVHALRLTYAFDPDLAENGTPEEILASDFFTNVDTSGLASPETDTAADTLLGGNGNDLLFLEAGDIGEGGSGTDSFFLNAVSASDNTITINDFTQGEDVIVIHYDAAQALPAVTLQDDGAGNAEILLDGELFTSLLGAEGQVEMSDISFVGIDPNA